MTLILEFNVCKDNGFMNFGVIKVRQTNENDMNLMYKNKEKQIMLGYGEHE